MSTARNNESTGQGHRLPPLARGELPEVPSLRRVVGPGVVLLAVSLGSAEYILWPYISSRVGLGMLWIALVGILTQFFVNMEIERYTLATGETAISGFSRLWQHWPWVFVIFVAVPWVWPAWATGASTSVAFVFGWDSGEVGLVTVLGLVAIGIALTVSPGIYRFVERVQVLLMVAVFVFLAIAVATVGESTTWSTMVTELGLRRHPDLNPGLLLGVLAFAGAGGTLNLTLSNWIRDKGMGMGAHVPRLESPFTGAPASEAPLGRIFAVDDPQMMHRWRGWWRVANQENLIFFALLGFAAIVLVSVLAASTLLGQEVGTGFDFIRMEGEALGQGGRPWLRDLFWLAGGLILFSTNLGILDHVGRLVADIVKSNWLRPNLRWSESGLYLMVVWTEIAIGSAILIFALSAPMTLLVIASSLNGIVMLVYSVLLVQLNRRELPGPIRIRGPRLGAMAWSIALFGYLSLYLIWTEVVPRVSGFWGAG